MKAKKVYQHISYVAVKRFRDEGHTLQEIGDYYDVSRQRIFQILHPNTKKPTDWDSKEWRRKRRERNRISNENN